MGFPVFVCGGVPVSAGQAKFFGAVELRYVLIGVFMMFDQFQQ